MTTKPSRILLFALAFALFILVPPFLSQPFPAYTDMHWADVFDVLTPLVLIPLYWLLFTDSGRVNRSLRLVVVFLVLAAVWVEGQGMHLSANSINNLLGPGSSAVNQLVHFYDEVLSHYLWHIGIVGLAVLLAAVRWESIASHSRLPWGVLAPAALLYGFTFFAAIIEGGTVPFGLPAAILIVLGLLVARREEMRNGNLVAFVFWSHIVALVFFAIWGIWQGGFPEFTEAGLL